MSGRRLGQHFLLDPTILERIVAAAHLSKEDIVVEIGPGLGRMTAMLADECKTLYAIELDDELVNKLVTTLADRKNINIVPADCLKYTYESLPPFRVVANIPYYITSPIIFRLMEPGVPLLSMTLTIQKEVADRLAAPPGSKTYGALSVNVQARMNVRQEFTISKKSFVPPPKVDSAVVTLHPRNPAPLSPAEQVFMSKLVKGIFSARRKTMSNCLKPWLPVDRILPVLTDLGVRSVERPENLSVDTFINLSKRVAQEIQSNSQ